MTTIEGNIDFVGDCIAESTAYFFVIILDFIFTPLIEIKIFERRCLAFKKIFLDFKFLTHSETDDSQKNSPAQPQKY